MRFNWFKKKTNPIIAQADRDQSIRDAEIEAADMAPKFAILLDGKEHEIVQASNGLYVSKLTGRFISQVKWVVLRIYLDPITQNRKDGVLSVLDAMLKSKLAVITTEVEERHWTSPKYNTVISVSYDGLTRSVSYSDKYIWTEGSGSYLLTDAELEEITTKVCDRQVNPTYLPIP